MKKENVKTLRELGLNLIPCGFKSKRPTIEWKEFQTKVYVGDIPENGNAAVICGRVPNCTGIVVLDLDSPELSNILFEDFEKIKQKTLVVQTGSGGHHIYIRPRAQDSTAGKRLTNNKGQHMDIQGDKTYVIAPGSIHPNGNEYKIISSTTQIMEIDLTGFINTLPRYGFNTEGSGLQPVTDIAKGVRQGMINSSAFKYACHLLSRVGLDQDTAWFEMKEWLKRCEQPTNERELETVFKSACRRIERDGIQEKKILKITPDNTEAWIEYLEKYIGENYNYDQLNEKFIMDIDPEIIQKCIKRYPMTFIDMVQEAIQKYGIDVRIQLSMTPTTELGSIKPDVGDEILCFDCEVVASEEKQTYTLRANFSCPNCGEEDHLVCDERRIIPTTKCDNCKKKSVLELIEGTIEGDYVQTVYISETIDEAKNGTPLTMKCRIFGDVVGESYAGQRKRIIGQFKSLPKKGSRFNEVVIDAIDVIGLDDKQVSFPTEEEIEEWKEKVKEPYFFNDFCNSCFTVLNNESLKQSCVLASVGATKLPTKNNSIHVLLLGDPGTAKSTLLEETQTFTFKSMYTGGKGNSAAGLAGGLDRPAPNMPMIFLPGVLTMMNNGLAIIDEIDKMRDGDRDSVLISMAQGYVPINKIGVHGKLPAYTGILAAANPRGGRWKPDKTILDQTNLEEPLLSRFDLIWLVKDEVNEYIDTGIAKHLTQQINPSQTTIIDGDKLTRYINYVKTLTPELTKDSQKKITEYYVKIRQSSQEYGNLPIDPRKILSLSKLAIAHARLHMKKETDVESVEVAYKLFADSLKSLNEDVEKGETREKTDNMDKWEREEAIHESLVTLFGDLQNIDENEFLEKLHDTAPASKFLSQAGSKRLWFNWKRANKLLANSDDTYHLEK